jgi:hypothetical protein
MRLVRRVTITDSRFPLFVLFPKQNVDGDNDYYSNYNPNDEWEVIVYRSIKVFITLCTGAHAEHKQ